MGERGDQWHVGPGVGGSSAQGEEPGGGELSLESKMEGENSTPAP